MHRITAATSLPFAVSRPVFSPKINTAANIYKPHSLPSASSSPLPSQLPTFPTAYITFRFSHLPLSYLFSSPIVPSLSVHTAPLYRNLSLSAFRYNNSLLPLKHNHM
ncbi:hypothetical protein I312_100300 [Cryptococcus bacillisporus CA1280]|uniref:uncharacterized protein n=1 Tax=Cryptococcus bacillisporus CA1280 TaxID=1296109 RepID=UPI0033698856